MVTWEEMVMTNPLNINIIAFRNVKKQGDMVYEY